MQKTQTQQCQFGFPTLDKKHSWCSILEDSSQWECLSMSLWQRWTTLNQSWKIQLHWMEFKYIHLSCYNQNVNPEHWAVFSFCCCTFLFPFFFFFISLLLIDILNENFYSRDSKYMLISDQQWWNIETL